MQATILTQFKRHWFDLLEAEPGATLFLGGPASGDLRNIGDRKYYTVAVTPSRANFALYNEPYVPDIREVDYRQTSIGVPADFVTKVLADTKGWQQANSGMWLIPVMVTW